MVVKAGGEDVLGRAGEPSFRVSAEDIAESRAEMILVMQCGYDAARNASQFRQAQLPLSWNALPALQEDRIYSVDANGYFSRPGPRLADGLELLAHLFYPHLFTSKLPNSAFQKL
jgi:iron complex transport system substrate-binding protein